MQLALEQLPTYLQQHGLPTLLSVFADSPLLLDDALQAVRHYAKQQGVDERSYFLQDSQFDWRQLLQGGHNLSLFASHRLLELELPEAKPGRDGADALKTYCEQPPPGQTLVIIGPKLKTEQLKSKWLAQLQQQGPVIHANSPERAALPRFVKQRAQRYQLQLEAAACELLAQWFEGNLLALDQELQKLALMDLAPPISASAIQASAQDHSRYNVFALQEAIVQGDQASALHRLQRLLEDEVELAILSWMLQREWQKLSTLAQAQARGEALAPLYPQLQIWRGQERLYQAFLQRMGDAGLRAAAQLLQRLELAFKRDSGEQVTTLVAHLVSLYCAAPKTQPHPAALAQRLCYTSF